MDRKRPVIGISAYDLPVAFSHWSDVRSVLVPAAYTASVERAGGLPIAIPPVDGSTELLDLVDGLVFTGGSDLDPALYGQQLHPETTGVHAARDRTELALIREALRSDMPVLGICRGMQLINVAFGGTLTQHLPDEVGHERHRPHPGSFDDSDHEVRLTEGSLAALAAGETVHNTKSHHHQGLEAIAEPFEVTGHSMIDDVPEAIEAPYRRFVLGVQWHPEADERSRVISALIERARDYRDTRVSA
jgi:putative glutamine amidotransferase